MVKISHEGDFEIMTIDGDSIMVRYKHEFDAVILHKIKTSENSYRLSSNFTELSRAKVNRRLGLRIAKEALLCRRIAKRKELVK